MNPADPVALRFPLVPRPRPACLPLPARIQALSELAREAVRQADKSIASTVLNQAALLASDVGMHDLARQWCRQHAAAHLRACPLSRAEAIRSLEPLVNLARLHIRSGHGPKAYDQLNDLYQAICNHQPARVDGITIPAHLTRTDPDGDTVRQWLWRVLIAEGTRALTSAGHWPQALTHLQRHRGIGNRMLDGRQVAIIASATSSDYDGAQQLLSATMPGEPWENAVAGCLAALCLPPGSQPARSEIDALADRYQHLSREPGLVVFTVRLALSIIDAARPTGQAVTQDLASGLTEQIVDAADGYAAREALAHDYLASQLSPQRTRQLAQIMSACALGHAHIPPRLLTVLTGALEASHAVIQA